jgi:hypothetical protein
MKNTPHNGHRENKKMWPGYRNIQKGTPKENIITETSKNSHHDKKSTKATAEKKCQHFPPPRGLFKGSTITTKTRVETITQLHHAVIEARSAW